MIREAHLVELVDSAGRPTGSCSVAEAHTAPGKAHRAFSVLLISDDGRVVTFISDVCGLVPEEPQMAGYDGVIVRWMR